MYERCLNEAERLLATSKKVVLPIKEVWRLLAAEGKRRSFDVPPLTDFDALLEGDSRFEVVSAQLDPDVLESISTEDGEEFDSNLGTLGFYPEDRVKLRRIMLPGENARRRTSVRSTDDDEDVVPFSVKGLSATKPVSPVDTGRQSAKKSNAKTPLRPRLSSKSPRKKGVRKSSPIRKVSRRSSPKKR